MVIDFEHHYVPMELARRMGINTEVRTIVEEDGVPKANVHGHLFNLERAVGDLGLKGVTISSQARGLSLDAEEFRPFYDVVTRLQIPIFVHPALRLRVMTC